MEELEARLKSPVVARHPLRGGCVADVYLLELQDGRRVVAKRRSRGDHPSLETEAWVLSFLAEKVRLPVPEVISATADLLLMEFVEGEPGLSSLAEEDAARWIAALHSVEGKAFGFARTTAIGPLPQDNRWQSSWIAFFRDQRLMPMGRRAHARGKLSNETLKRLECLCGQLDRWLEEPPSAALLHGDLWDGNIIRRQGRIAAFLDPASYFGHPEVELAFGTLFGTLKERFFARYAEFRPIAPGFFEVRRDIYNLYPLLVHATLFGSSYGAAAARILERHV